MDLRDGPSVADVAEHAPDSEGSGQIGPAWLAKWRRNWAILIVVIVSLSTLGAGGAYVWWKWNRPHDPPDGPWPTTARFKVALCTEGRDHWELPGCENRGAATQSEKQVIEAKIRSLPGVTQVRLLTRADVTAQYKAEVAFREDPPVLSEDISEAFVGTLRTRQDGLAFESGLGRPPGVSMVFAYGEQFWRGKADIHIALCPETGLILRCKGRGQTTREEKAAIEAAVWSVAGVERIYFARRAHALQVSAYLSLQPVDTSRRSFSQIGGGYWLKVRDKATMKTIFDKVRHMSGVQQVFPILDD